MRRAAATAALPLILIACSGSTDEAKLMSEARSAVLPSLEDAVSARFDESNATVFVDKGLVCGARFKAKDQSGRYTEFEPYYFASGRGAAFSTSNAALYATLARECSQALRHKTRTEAHRSPGRT